MKDILDGKYMFPELKCRYCEQEIKSGNFMYMAWSRPFCSRVCRADYNTTTKSKSVLERMNEYFKYVCNL